MIRKCHNHRLQTYPTTMSKGHITQIATTQQNTIKVKRPALFLSKIIAELERLYGFL